MEVVVHCCHPARHRRTIPSLQRPEPFPTRPNATVEDLLRKLPGIEIDKNGNVTMQGQKVDKIYLDGKEFFLNDPRTATQNLPADIRRPDRSLRLANRTARLTGIKETTGTKS